MILNRANLSDLFVAFKAAFNTGFRSVQSDYEKIATVVPSSTSEEHYAWLGQFPRLREWVGERQLKQMASYDYRIKNKTFESTVRVLREHLEDDQYGIYSPLMQEMGHASATHPNELVFGLLALGFSTLCYDGQFFFDVDHPVGRENAASVSNFGGGAGTAWYLLDTSRPIKPLIFQKRRDYHWESLNNLNDDHVFKNKEFLFGVDARVNAGFGFWQQAYASKQALDATNFNAAYAAMMNLKSDEGRPLGIRATHLVVPPTLRAQALEVVKSERNAAGATNINQNAVEILVTPWLT